MFNCLMNREEIKLGSSSIILNCCKIQQYKQVISINERDA